MTEGPKKLGLIAGSGALPAVIAAEARRMGRSVVVVALEGLAGREVEGHADAMGKFNAGKLGSIIKFLKESGAHEAVMAGKISKSLLYNGKLRPDLKAVGLLMKLRDRRDDTIIDAVAEVFKKDGVEFLDMRDFCAGLLTEERTYTKKGPSKDERKDIEFGFRMAKGIGELDIGQTVVVKDRAVMAVEAVEGSDEAIRRGGLLAGAGSVVVKVSRPKQDMRFDVPVVGMDTLQAMEEVRARVLALDAGKSILMDKEEFLKKAAGSGITVIGVSG